MIVLDVQSVRKHFGPEPVLDGATFQVYPGERIALVGPNGCGKSTLLAIIAGRVEADAGSCTRHPSIHFGELRQQVRLASGHTVYQAAERALAGLKELQQEMIDVAEAMATAEHDEQQRLAARYDHLQHELERLDAYNVDHKIRRVLAGLGFAEAVYEQSVESLSGGEQNRLMLARLLLAEPNLMLLDEPSNHLDIAATEWLEGWLVESSAAMLIVSHDRQLLDRAATRTLELVQGTVDSYSGNFSAYQRQKEERILVERRTYEKQREEIAKTEDFIRRNSYGQKHAQAEDRRKKLERIELVDPPREIQSPPMGFPPAARAGDIVLRAEGIRKRFEKPLLSGVTFQIERGERWAVIGPNGSGKTTLLKCLVGLEQPDGGISRLGTGVRLGYFDQHLDELHDEAPAYEAIRPPRKELDDGQRRDLLARFGVTGDTALQPVGSLSGGERCRVALARLAAADANFLVLDEPTNHLDIWAREALQQALLNFGGTVLLVSHDRYFINHVADHILGLEADRVRAVAGNYDTYRQTLQQSAPPKPASPSSAKQHDKAEPGRPGKQRLSRRSNRNESASDAPRRRRFPFRKVSDLEADIASREETIRRLHSELADGATHRDGERARAIKQQLEEEHAAIETLVEHWEEAMELNW